MHMTWETVDGGGTIGSTGSEQGEIIRDDEFQGSARITIERDGGIAPFAITCGVYGWMVHTRFFDTEQESLTQFEEMKSALTELVDLIPPETDSELDEKMTAVTGRISEFVDRFP